MFFQKFIEPLLQPFRQARSKVVSAKNMRGQVKLDVNRVKNLKNQNLAAAKGLRDKAANMQPGQPTAGPQPGAIKTVGLFRKRRVCASCSQEMDPTWEWCPYCVPPPAQSATVAFAMDAAGTGASTQLLGWIVPVEGSQRGELFTLAPLTSVGTDPLCTVVLDDRYMSSRHAEIKAEGGTWILRDLGSTNGTFVNDKRVDTIELVDNDFIKFGGSLVKFKSL